MAWEEAKKWLQGNMTSDYFQELLKNSHRWPYKERKKQVIKPWEMPWEVTPNGIIKWLANEKMDIAIRTLDAYMLFIPPYSRSGKERHLAEEYVYVVEGKGYDLHQDCDFDITEQGYNLQCSDEIKRFDWKAGDVIYIPPNVIHQHFNASNDKPARLIVAMSRLYKWAGLNDFEIIENAPEYDEAKSLPPDKLVEYVAKRLGKSS
ncbi:cupin domain-containing protein [Sulfolobus tengchongensis]|uniref:Cupin domain-containing protein n=1 Tax=Sulfolobus tengchongensis TaxID=207809 RepID=A0AAX4L4M4_9CREN